MVRTVVALSALAFAILATPITAAAQTDKGDVAVSYSFLHDPDVNFPVGWLVAGTAPVNKTIGIVGEVGGNYKSDNFDGFKVSLQEYGFLGGVKAQFAAAPKVTVFGQMLTGATMLRGSAEGDSDSTFAFTLQPGGGIDAMLAPKLGLRVQGDYRWVTKDGESLNQFRLAVGLVFKL